MIEKKKVVVIGGGTGIHPVLQGLKKYHEEIDITAIISMADSGGSTGRLRDEFGLLPVGDVRMALIALASDVDEHEELLRKLFLYRFAKGEGLNGHNFGNLLIVALTEILGSEAEAVQTASKILRIRGQVLPVTSDKIHLVAEYDNGEIVTGEHNIDEPPQARFDNAITNLYTEPVAIITEDAKQAISEADLIVLGPGDLYTSLLANCVVGGVGEAIKQAQGQFVFAVNLMTKPGQTSNLTATGHVAEVEKYVGRKPDVVIINTGEVPAHLLERYKANHQFVVTDDGDNLSGRVMRADLLHKEEVKQKNGDKLSRSLVRGDGDKFAELLVSLL